MKEVTESYQPDHLLTILNEACFRVHKKGRNVSFNPSRSFVRVFDGGNYMSAIIQTEDDRIFMGIAKRNPTDPFKPSVGLEISIYRAVRSSAE